MERRGFRWKERSDDPELERQLIEELERRRQERIAQRRQRALDRRSRRFFALFVALALGISAVLGYEGFLILRSLFG